MAQGSDHTGEPSAVDERKITLPGHEGRDRRGRPYTRITIQSRPIDVIVVEDPGREGIRLVDVTSEVSVGSVRMTKLGETRYRVDFPNGSSVCQTVHGPAGHWQSGHWHQNAHESYYVEKGCIFLVWDDEGGVRRHLLLHAGGRYVFAPGIHHNVYAFGGAMTLVEKFGCSAGASEDKTDDHELTAACKNITEAEMIELGTPGGI